MMQLGRWVMRNNRGQFFALYLVFITLFLCGVVAGFYYIQQDNVRSALVSPMGALKEIDSLDMFEREEVVLIYNSLENAEGDFGDDDFLNSFRENFLNEIMTDNNMREFIFRDLFSIVGSEIREQDKNENMIENAIYPSGGSEFVDEQLVFTRAKISKNYLMLAKDKSKINFPVNFNFEFERKYLIKQIDGNFEVGIA